MQVQAIEGRFRDKLEAEFVLRRTKNNRYSVRAFAAFLGTDHSSLAQILRGSRPIPAASIRVWARKLGLDSDEAAVFVAAERIAPAADTQRAQQLRHWTAEALAVMNEPAHFEILRLTREPGFQADARWIAAQSGVSVDRITLALTRLLRLGMLEMRADGMWKDLTQLNPITGQAVHKLALERVRQAAAANGVRFAKPKSEKRSA